MASVFKVDHSVYTGLMKRTGTPTKPDLPARERILLTAHDLFYRNGIRATGIDRVIAEAGVTKVTFYRHFPSKNDLICEFLEYRHRRWMDWFVDALQRHGGDLNALSPALAEWFGSDIYRGCAFINSVGELGPVLPGVVEISRRHKQEMTAAIEDLMPESDRRGRDAEAIAIAVDGAIIRAQFDESPDAALEALERIVESLSGG
jgi:AcrR family transcriptional regulator